MKTHSRKNIFRYLSDQFIGTFTGFVIGIWASSLVSHFFATRRLSNLWGLASRKTVVDKPTFGMLEWLASVLVGYLVFEVMVRFIKNYFLPRFSGYRLRLMKFLVRTGWYTRFRDFARAEDPMIQEMP